MNKEITRVDYCEYCGEWNHIVVRSSNVNSDLSDKDIGFMIAYRDTPHSYAICNSCNNKTLIKTIAFLGVNDE